jgi:hypothetical protein
MTDNYRLQVKLGDAEFSAEGAEKTVRQDYDSFLKALGSRPAAVKAATPASPPAQNAEAGEVGQQLIDRVFSRDGDIVSLRHLPPEESANKGADAGILIMYGYRRLLNTRDVGVVKLKRGLVRTGVTVDRVDRILASHTKYFMKGGSRVGSYYTLNNLGEKQAETWLKTWFQ